MRSSILVSLLMMAGFAFGQSHTIDEHDLYMSGDVEDGDISINTYFNAIDAVQVNWSIIETDVPEGWEYSFCFPNCHAIGVLQASADFPAASEQYLNCHVYPNGIAGEGHIRMLITTNGAAQDTVTWWATIDALSGLETDRISEIQAYPSPFSGTLNLQGIPAGATITFHDQTGALVHHVSSGAARKTSVDHLPQGLLFMTTSLDGEIIDRRRVLSL